MFVYIIISAFIGLYFFLKLHFSYWSRAGLESYNSTSFFESIGSKIYGTYYQCKQKGLKHGGTFLFFKSIYVPVDLDIVKNIVQIDFKHFVNRGFIKDPPPLAKHLVNMEDEEWRTWRARLTPTFTSGKMKMMFHTMAEKTLILGKVIKEQAVINEPVDIKELFARYTTDVIGSTGFGIECNSLENPTAEFREFGKQLSIRPRLILQLPPFLLKLFRVRLFPEELESFFLNVIKSTVKYRESNNIFRKDFMHLLLQLKNKGKVSADDDENVLGDQNKVADHVSLYEIAAQCLVFFAAGFGTSSTTLSFAMLELAQNQEIQDKLRKNIRDVVRKHGQISYEAIMEMDYLDKVVQETLRKHPVVQTFPRICNKDYPVPGTKFVIKKGQQIFLPFRAIHRDPEYWPEPEKFDPERFSPENKATRHRYAFLPFGEGPRICIGARFGLLQTKMGMVSIIKDFKVTLNDRTPKPVEIRYDELLTSVKEDLWINVEAVE